MTDLGPQLRQAFDRVPGIDLDMIQTTRSRRRNRRRRMFVASAAAVASAAVILVALLLVPATTTTLRVGPAVGSGLPEGATCGRLGSTSIPPGSAGRLRVPTFDAVLLCQFVAANTGDLEFSALASTTSLSGPTAAQFQAALRSAPAWVPTYCAFSSDQNPVVQALLYRHLKPVGTIFIPLSTCPIIEGPYGRATADASFQATLNHLMDGDGAVVAGPMAGTWHVHTYYLNVTADGHGAFTWPIHTTCGTGVDQGAPPCDTLKNGTEIIDGGYARLTIIERSGDTAMGIIQSSTDQSTLPDGPVTLRLAANDLLYLTTSGVQNPHPYEYLCGEQAVSLPVAEQLSQHINCGA